MSRRHPKLSHFPHAIPYLTYESKPSNPALNKEEVRLAAYFLSIQMQVWVIGACAELDKAFVQQGTHEASAFNRCALDAESQLRLVHDGKRQAKPSQQVVALDRRAKNNALISKEDTSGLCAKSRHRNAAQAKHMYR